MPHKATDRKDKNIVERAGKHVSIVVKGTPVTGPVATAVYTNPMDEESLALLSQKPLRRQKPRRLSRD